MTLRFTVTGVPAPQGSKKGFVVNGRAVIVDDNQATLKSWRSTVTEAAVAARAGRPPLEGPLEVTIVFRMPRPGYHFGSGRNVGVLKATAPTFHFKKPDRDKLERAVLDALTAAGVWRDDAQAAVGFTSKEYATHPRLPGADIAVSVLHDPATVGPVGDDTHQGALL